MPFFTTACPRNCYSTCAMRVEVLDGRLRRIEPHPGNRATAGGPCLKGLSYVERVVSPRRILHPLRRRRHARRNRYAGRSSGQPEPRTGCAAPAATNASSGPAPPAHPEDFERISWDEALDEIAGRLRAAREEHGPRSILYYAASGTKGLLHGVGMRFWRLFGGCTTTYGDLCWPAGLEATRLTLGENKHSAPWDLANAKLILLWGRNAAETNLHQMVFVDQALDRGATLVVIDPRRTQTAERARLLVQPRPGTDGALAMGLAHLLIREDRIDRGFLDRHVLGFDAFADRASAWPPDRTARVTGVPERLVRRLAAFLGTIRPATISPGYGMQRYTNSGQTMRAMLALLAITGNLGKPGAGWVYANLQSHVFDPVRDPLALYPPERPDGVVRVSIATARLGRDLLAQRDPPVRAAWIERGNPVAQNPETPAVLRALRGLDFVVVVDQFLTDTALEADVILPAKTMFEQSDIIGAYWHHELQLKQKVLEPPEEVKPESEIYRLLGERLGIPETSDPACFPVTDAEVDAFLERALEPFPGITLARLREGPLPAPGSQEVAFGDLVFPTPSGRIELRSEEARRRWGVDEVAGFTESAESIRTGGAAADLPPPAEAGAESIRPLEAGADPARTARQPRVPRRPRHPLHLLTPNTKNRIHSQFQNLEMIRQVSPGPFTGIHPLDARHRGIADGDLVRVFNDRGALVVAARIDPGCLPGCVWITNGWWVREGGGVNLLSAARETDMGHGAAFHDVRVEVERARTGGARGNHGA